VENQSGIAQFLDCIPLFYVFGDWSEALFEMAHGIGNLPLLVGRAAETLMKFALHELINQHLFVNSVRSRVHEFIGNADTRQLLHDRPMTYTLACVIEVLGRWQFKGIPVSNARLDDTMLQSVLRSLPRELHRKKSESVRQTLAECVPSLRRVIRDEPRLGYLVPILTALVEGMRPALPPTDFALLRESLHRHMACSSLECFRTLREDGRPLLRCGGDCGGLARYCCAEHQKAHWPVHKVFCKRKGSMAATFQ
jgi:hypothetical protein